MREGNIHTHARAHTQTYTNSRIPKEAKLGGLKVWIYASQKLR